MWKYYNPVEVVFGTGKLDELGQLMAERGLDRALIVSDPFTHRSGVAARLKECAGGRVLDIISEVEPNPTCQFGGEFVEAGLAAAGADDLPAFLDEAAGGFAADTGGDAGDEDDFLGHV